jgi:hypothetical protein
LNDKTVLICDKCGLPFARVQGGALVIESRHHGQVHVNVLSVDELVRVFGGSEREPKERIARPYPDVHVGTVTET